MKKILLLLFGMVVCAGPVSAQTSTGYNNQGLVKFKAKDYAGATTIFFS